MGNMLLSRKDSLEHTQRFFEKHGGKAVFMEHFAAWLRAMAPFVAGISKMPYLKFLLFDVPGGMPWVVAFSLLGYFLE
jgi:membrane-associated protein